MEWISVKDRLPTGDEDVLVAITWHNGMRSVDISWYDSEEWAMGSSSNYAVTHWQPIMDLPPEAHNEQG